MNFDEEFPLTFFAHFSGGPSSIIILFASGSAFHLLSRHICFYSCTTAAAEDSDQCFSLFVLRRQMQKNFTRSKARKNDLFPLLVRLLIERTQIQISASSSSSSEGAAFEMKKRTKVGIPLSSSQQWSSISIIA
jgi:hypothetical protein